MSDITFSIVTYNSERHIRKVIDSIVDGMSPVVNMKPNLLSSMAFAGITPCHDPEDGSSPDYSIIIIDNASTDGTALAVKEARAAHPGLIEWLPQKTNRGFGAGHNHAIPLMKGCYHVVVNPDIVIPRGMLLEMTRWMEANPEVGLLTPRVLFPDGRLQYLCKHNPTFTDLFLRLFMKNAFRRRQEHFEMRDTGYDHEFKVEYATGCFMFFRTEIYLRIHGFDEKFFLYLEDADITRRVNEVSSTVFVPSVQVVHEWQRDQHRKLSLMWVNLMSWAHYAAKWHKRRNRTAKPR